FSVQYAPPDTNGAVGPTNYVQIVNVDFAVFDKSGKALYGPVPTNTLWSGFGGGCQSNNDGDATVVYDRAVNRWIFQQFSVSTTPVLRLRPRARRTTCSSSARTASSSSSSTPTGRRRPTAPSPARQRCRSLRSRPPAAAEPASPSPGRRRSSTRWPTGSCTGSR